MSFLMGAPDGEEEVLSDINITPLVDVMLVLLIIFMITAPMLQTGIEVALPKADAPNLETKSQEPLILTLASNGLIHAEMLNVLQLGDVLE